MSRSVRDSSFAVLVAVATVAGLQWFIGVGYVSVSLVTGLCAGCATKLVLYVGDRYPAFATGESWADKRWASLSAAVVSLAALLGVGPGLPLTNELRLALGLLVLSSGLAAYTAGSLAVLERVENDEAVDATDHATPADD